MSRNHLSLALLAAVLGAWGCSSSGESPETIQIRGLEAKVNELERDRQKAVVERDQLGQKLEGVEKDRALLQKQLQQTVQERNDLRLQLTARITERDTVVSQFDLFRKELRTLLGQADAAAVNHRFADQPMTSANASPPATGQ